MAIQLSLPNGVVLTQDQRDLLEQVREYDGMEVPQPWWDDAEALEKAGLCTLGGARGPNRYWRRLESVDA